MAKRKKANNPNEEKSIEEPKQMQGSSLNQREIQMRKLYEAFPEAVSEERIDWEKLRLTLGDDVALTNERYVFNWAGKSEAFRAIQTPTTATLRPKGEQSVDFDISNNIFIEGENLEVLKVMQKSYYGKVKMIYIDPPYNSGNDRFIYPDKFSESKEEYLRRIGDKDEAGYLTKEGFFRKNSKENGQFHSNWLSMMYPRLFLARNLLRDDGVIFVSIDNDEVHNLKMLLNEIFGEENFVECITWNKRIPKNDKGIGSIHEYVLLYSKRNDTKPIFKLPKEGIEDVYELVEKLKARKTPIEEAREELRKFYEKKQFDRGITLYNELDENYEIWGKINLSWPNATSIGPKYDVLHPLTQKKVRVPDRGWRWKSATFDEYLDYDHTKVLKDGSVVCGKIWFAEDEKTQPSFIQYLKDVNDLLLRSVVSLKSSGGIEADELLGQNIFPYPKPVDLVKHLISSCTTGNDIVFDFFAGSGTTGQAVLELNEENGDNRQFILVQLAERTEENTDAYKAGYKTIAHICIERIKRVSKEIEKEVAAQPDLFKNKELDLGVKVFALEPSNFKVWRTDTTDTEEELKQQMEAFVDPVRVRAEANDMAWEILLKSGYSLTTSMERVEIGGLAMYSIASGELVLMLEKITQKGIDAVMTMKPMRVICLDRLFSGNDQLKTNTVLQMKDAGIEFRTI